MAERIKKISVFTHCNDLGGKVWNPAIRWTRKHAVFVVLTDAAGRRGLGESWCFDAAPDALVAYLRTEVIPHFIGAVPEEVPDIAQGLMLKATLTARHGILASALSGIDIAAWDLRAQSNGLPLWRCLSDDGPGRASLYASGGLYGENKSVSDLVGEMTQFSRQGFRLVKMKIGAASQDEDVARVRAVLDTQAADVRVIVDGVYSYSVDAAARVFDALPFDRIEAFQSPTPASDYAGMARLAKLGVPVMATEAEYRPELHAKLVQDAEVAFLQTAPIASGGLTRVGQLASLVADTPTRLSLEVSSTAVALMAAVQAACAEPLIAHVEHHSVHTVFFDRLRLQQGADGEGRYTPQPSPGLGITLPTDEVSMVLEIGSDPLPKNAA